MFSSAYTITNLKIWSSETNAVLSLHTNFLLHSGPVISNLNPFPFDLVSAISCLVFFELPLFRAVCPCFEVIVVDLCCPWPKINFEAQW